MSEYLSPFFQEDINSRVVLEVVDELLPPAYTMVNVDDPHNPTNAELVKRIEDRHQMAENGRKVLAATSSLLNGIKTQEELDNE
ncbi:MAG: hypothetical protein ACREGJ_01100 [Candidatus Saccharimonadales bacterium]